MKYNIFVFFIVLFVSCSNKKIDIDIISPNNTISGCITQKSDSLYFQMKYNQKNLIKNSPILLYYNNDLIFWKIKSSKSHIVQDDFKMSIGEFDQVSHSSIQKDFVLEGKTSNNKTIDAELQVRSFNNAFAYRFIFKSTQKKYTIEERSEIRLIGRDSKLFMPNGEKEPIGNVSLHQLKVEKSLTPLIIKNKNNFFSFHEANLHNYPMLQTRFIKESNSVAIASGKAVLEGCVELPWRIFFYGQDMAELHNQKSIYLTLNKPSKGDFSWVRPGIAMWDWRVKGTTFSGFKYEMNDKSLKRYIDFAAKAGFSYFLLDAEWYAQNPLIPVSTINIKDVIKYANSNNVGVILYYDLEYTSPNNPEIDFEKIARVYSSWGAKGVKYGFLGGKGPKYTSQEKTKHTEKLIKIAAKNKLLIDFHDSPIPFGGLERTYPNYINREYCHAQLDCRLAFDPKEFVKIACINMLAGQIDQTNGTYALNEMKTRTKGPRNDYNSTVSSETARFFITHTGHFSVLIDAPEAYMDKEDLFSFIKALPERWDETLYLEMDFNSHVSIARRSGNTWYIGVVYNEKGGIHNLNLNFLNEGKYEMTIYSDAENSHFIKNKEAYKISKQIVKKGDNIKVYVVPGGGYSVLLYKK